MKEKNKQDSWGMMEKALAKALEKKDNENVTFEMKRSTRDRIKRLSKDKGLTMKQYLEIITIALEERLQSK